MTVHTPKSHEEAESFKLSEMYNDLRTQISGLKGPEALGLQRYVDNTLSLQKLIVLATGVMGKQRSVT